MQSVATSPSCFTSACLFTSSHLPSHCRGPMITTLDTRCWAGAQRGRGTYEKIYSINISKSYDSDLTH